MLQDEMTGPDFKKVELEKIPLSLDLRALPADHPPLPPWRGARDSAWGSGKTVMNNGYIEIAFQTRHASRQRMESLRQEGDGLCMAAFVIAL